MTQKDRNEIAELVAAAIEHARPRQTWLQKNWHLPGDSKRPGSSLALVFLGKMSGNIDNLNKAVSEIRDKMVLKETLDLKFEGTLQTNIKDIKERPVQA